MKLYDSHAHLDMEPLAADKEAAVERAHKAGITGIINVGSSLRGSKRSVALSESYPNIWASVGLHPHEAETLLDLDTIIDELRELTESDKVVAIGEIGLDYFDHATGSEVTGKTKEAQKLLFERQLDLALERKLPVILHIRDAWDDAFNILRRKKIRSGVVHCFTGGEAEVEKVLDLGFYVGFTGFVTFEQAKFDAIRAAAKLAPLERILVETDAPFLAPEPHRGKTNEPAYVVEIARKIAALKGITYDDFCAASAKNTEMVFNIVS